MTLISRILVPTDFSDCAARALEYALSLATKVGASVVLVHVFTPPIVYMPEGIWAMPAGERNLHDKLEEALQKLAAQCRETSSRPVEAVIAEGEAAKQIVSTAEAQRCDLIVMGTHGRSGLSHILIGSVAETVVQHSRCPVLTLRLPKA
ncbi:MAG: universal stress protein [Kofleriaceae bacterium]